LAFTVNIQKRREGKRGEAESEMTRHTCLGMGSAYISSSAMDHNGSGVIGIRIGLNVGFWFQVAFLSIGIWSSAADLLGKEKYEEPNQEGGWSVSV